MKESSSTERYMPLTSSTSGMIHQIAEGVYVFTVQIVNVCFVTIEETGDWFLIDAGMPKSEEKIIEAAEEIYGAGAKPKAIILTHGHFDHVGSIFDLTEKWKVPVYAHSLEMPFLTGERNYPEADTSAHGLLAMLSPLFPHEGIDLGTNIHPLPANGSIPEMAGWKWLHTPGHTPGHVSLYRENDKTLIVGDAFVTVKQESLYKVLTQEQEISGPPKYFTSDWEAARKSVELLRSLNPEIAITGHGIPMAAAELEHNLDKLVNEFDSIALP